MQIIHLKRINSTKIFKIVKKNIILIMMSDDIIKIIYLLNAKANGWEIIYKNESTFYIIKEKNSTSTNFIEEIRKLKKKPINLCNILKELNN